MAILRFRTVAVFAVFLVALAAGHAAPTPPLNTAGQPPETPMKPGTKASPEGGGAEIPAGSFDLRPKFRFGQDRRVRLSLDSKETKPDLTTELDPAKPANGPKKADDEMKTKQDFVLIFRPTKVNEDGTSEVSIVFESIRSHVEGPGVDDSFDSSKPPPAPSKKPAAAPADSDPLGGLGKMPTLEETLRPLVGEKLSLVFDKDGNVLDVRGGEKFVRALNPMAPEEMTQMGVGGDEKLRDLFKSIVGTPGKSYAKPGEKWSSETALDVFPVGGSRLHTDYSLTDVKGAKGRIGFQGKMVPSKESSPGAGGLKFNKADYSGFTDWDQEDGFARSMQSTQALDAELKIGQQSISLKQSQKMTLERLPDSKTAAPLRR